MIRKSVKDFARPLFPLGQVVATKQALQTLLDLAVAPTELILRHQYGDWKELDEYDRQQNILALRIQARILSVYEIKGKRLWVITEGDRSSTTILLPEEY